MKIGKWNSYLLSDSMMYVLFLFQYWRIIKN